MFVFDSICIIFGGTTKSSTPLSHLRNQCCGKWSPNILAMHSWCFTFLARSKCITKLVPSIWWTQKEDPGFHLVAVSISGGFNPSPVPVLSIAISTGFKGSVQKNYESIESSGILLVDPGGNQNVATASTGSFHQEKVLRSVLPEGETQVPPP